MPITIQTIAGKGSPLNPTEHDANITNLKNAIENVTTGHDHDGTDSKRIAGASSWGNRGYQTLGDGLIIQWGRDEAANTGQAQITLPIAFPTTCLWVGGSTDYDGMIASAGKSNTALQTNIFIALKTEAGVFASGGVYWLALGY